jgi:tetratricopeptide (TPR) repeat protein
MEGGGVLEEWESEVGVILWQASRDVLLWATTEPDLRGETFSPQAIERHRHHLSLLAEAVPELRVHPALQVLHQVVAEASTVRHESVARACRQISEWADREGKLVTALAFAQDAALSARGDAGAAFWVATLAVRLNDHARAEVWFRRAVGLARQSRDWRMYSRAFGGLGNLYIRRGNLPAARRLHIRALRGARRGGMRREQATALHDLFAVAVETGNARSAERLAAEALQAYGTRNRRVHVLAHDVAYFWMEQGYFDRALAVFQAVLPLIERPLERLFVLADVARAAGGVGDPDTALQAANEVWAFARDAELELGMARALLEVARGFMSLGEWARAEEAARHALASAIRLQEGKVRFAAEAVLSAVGSGEAVHASPPAVPPRSDEETSQGDLLAREFVKTLEVIAGTAP